MYENELGAMFRSLFSMTEERILSDYAVGKAAMEFVEAAMNRVIEKEVGALSPAERMDLESGILPGEE